MRKPPLRGDPARDPAYLAHHYCAAGARCRSAPRGPDLPPGPRRRSDPRGAAGVGSRVSRLVRALPVRGDRPRPLAWLRAVRAPRPVDADHGDAVGGGTGEHGDAIQRVAPGRDPAEDLRLALTGHGALLVQPLNPDPTHPDVPYAPLRH